MFQLAVWSMKNVHGAAWTQSKHFGVELRDREKHGANLEYPYLDNIGSELCVWVEAIGKRHRRREREDKRRQIMMIHGVLFASSVGDNLSRMMGLTAITRGPVVGSFAAFALWSLILLCWLNF